MQRIHRLSASNTKQNTQTHLRTSNESKSKPLELLAIAAEVGVVVEPGWKGNAAEFESRVKKAHDAGKTALDRLKFMMGQADELVADIE